MENFVFQNPTKIIFGRDTERQVGMEVKQYTDRVLLHYGGGSIKKSGLYDRVVASLKEAGVDFVELSGVQPNPRIGLIREGVELCRKHGIRFILAVGGGSVIDSAKGIAVGVPYEGDVWDFYLQKAVVKQALPVGVVLTIPAAGSETSPASVVTNEEGALKRDIGTDLIRPKFAILNPELTFTLPPYQTACGAADIMAHVMERYFTRVKETDLTDRLCESTLRTVIKYTPLALQNPTDYAARAELMWASTVAHSDLLGTGRIGDWASHMIEHELSGIYDVAHGAGLAVVFPAWMQYVYQEDVRVFAKFATRVWGVEPDFADLESTALAGIERVKDFFRSIGLPVTLTELKIGTDRLEEMAAKCTERGPVGNFKRLDREDVHRIYRLAL
ncbi:MAG TPA: iron-containing alcohol dehydrogenase [Firmicutes bacterium]|nr:iron-containing alcohol dehydrogenase [Bacillota bacterium]